MWEPNATWTSTQPCVAGTNIPYTVGVCGWLHCFRLLHCACNKCRQAQWSSGEEGEAASTQWQCSHVRHGVPSQRTMCARRISPHSFVGAPTVHTLQVSKLVCFFSVFLLFFGNFQVSSGNYIPPFGARILQRIAVQPAAATLG